MLPDLCSHVSETVCTCAFLLVASTYKLGLKKTWQFHEFKRAVISVKDTEFCNNIKVEIGLKNGCVGISWLRYVIIIIITIAELPFIECLLCSRYWDRHII